MRAQSESIGVILVTGVVVLLVTTIGVAGLATFSLTDTDREQATLVEIDITAENVSVLHAGGERVAADDVTVWIRHNGTEERYHGENLSGTDIWEPGDKWTIDDGPYNGEVVVYVVHDPTNTVLQQRRAFV